MRKQIMFSTNENGSSHRRQWRQDLVLLSGSPLKVFHLRVVHHRYRWQRVRQRTQTHYRHRQKDWENEIHTHTLVWFSPCAQADTEPWPQAQATLRREARPQPQAQTQRPSGMNMTRKWSTSAWYPLSQVTHRHLDFGDNLIRMYEPTHMTVDPHPPTLVP
jgi:hypothetical protein